MRKLIGSFLRGGLAQKGNRFTFVQTKGMRKVNFSTMKEEPNQNEVPDEVKRMMQSQQQQQKKKPQELPILKDISEARSMDQLP